MKCQLMVLLISLSIISSIQSSPRSRRATVLDGGNLVIVEGNVHVVNGQVISGNGCYYHKDKVTDNGKTRAMTKSERVQLDKYLRDSKQATEKFQQDMQSMFAPPFPFGGSQGAVPMLQLPEVPCFCSKATCSEK